MSNIMKQNEEIIQKLQAGCRVAGAAANGTVYLIDPEIQEGQVVAGAFDLVAVGPRGDLTFITNRDVIDHIMDNIRREVW